MILKPYGQSALRLEDDLDKNELTVYEDYALVGLSVDDNKGKFWVRPFAVWNVLGELPANECCVSHMAKR